MVHRFQAFTAVAFVALLATTAAAQSPSDADVVNAVALQQVPPRVATRSARGQELEPRTPEPRLSDAERLARLRRAIEADEKRLKEMQQHVDNPAGEFHKADTEFKSLDEKLENLRRELQALQQAGKPEEAARVQSAVDELQKNWELAKDRLQLALQERKTLQENIATLSAKLQTDREALRKLTEPTTLERSPETSPGPAASEAPVALPAADPTDAADDREVAPVKSPLAGAIPGMPIPLPQTGASDQGNSATPSQRAATVIEKLRQKELEKAADTVEQRLKAADEADQQLQAITTRIDLLRRNIELGRQLRDTARKKIDNADQTLEALHAEFFRKLQAGEGTGDLQRRIAETTERRRLTYQEARRASTHLDELQSELARLQSEQLGYVQDAERKRRAALAAQREYQELQNPFSARNLMQWALFHGPRILAVILAMLGFVWLSRVMEGRLIRLMTLRGRRGSAEERENRARTLLGVFRNAANVLIIGGGFVTLMDEVGVPVGPLMGGAAVLGLAVAFGAQSLIKDYFTGFMVLLEQQYLVNDVVRIGDISGQVERISLRMTVLRDLEGRVHFIPHGQITSVTNMTHGWSRAVLDVAVAYHEDADQVMEVLQELSHQLMQDPEYGPLILEEPTMLGVDALGESSVVIKFYIKTRPLKQWIVKRELLRRIKKRFDELGIEIPFPHRTVYFRPAPGGPDGEGAPWTRREVA